MINKRQEVSTESLRRHERGEKVVLVVELMDQGWKSMEKPLYSMIRVLNKEPAQGNTESGED